ncbi:MAG TPA: hypothetical protein VN554_02075, partial [Verrucomicrobiae bacterium]|nr:hypothetical protein [Verrucomicrobiae bacterium]
MKKHTDTIVINGRAYHAGTGALLSHDAHEAPASPTPIHHRPRIASSDSSPTTSTQMPVSRRPARHVTAHPRTRGRTLMRQGVQKPGPSAKRRTRVQAYIDTPIRPHAVKTRTRTATRHPAVKSSKSQLISHF